MNDSARLVSHAKRGGGMGVNQSYLFLLAVLVVVIWLAVDSISVAALPHSTFLIGV